MSALAALLTLLIAAPVPAPAPVVEGYFPGAGGVRLFHRKVGTGPKVVVFLHGGPGSNFRGAVHYIEPLAGGDHAIVLYDQRGGGLSELVTDPALVTAEDHVRDLEALRVHLGVERMTLIGHSWGAGLAAMYADRHPGRVDRLVLVSPIAPAREPFWDQRLARMNTLRGEAASARRSAILARLAEANDAETVALCREQSDDTFRHYFHRATPAKLTQAAMRCDIPPAAIRNRSKVEAATLASLGDWDFRTKLARLSKPALVIEGARTNVPLDATLEWAATLPNARMLLIPEAGHEVFADQPKVFTAAVKQFLEGRNPRGAEVVPGPDAH